MCVFFYLCLSLSLSPEPWNSPISSLPIPPSMAGRRSRSRRRSPPRTAFSGSRPAPVVAAPAAQVYSGELKPGGSDPGRIWVIEVVKLWEKLWERQERIQHVLLE